MSAGQAYEVPTVWVVSYPKSGNTWMRLLIRSYFLEVCGRPPKELTDASTYWYQTVSPKELHNLRPDEFCQLRPAAMMHLKTLFGYQADPDPLLVVKSHNASASFHDVPLFSRLWSENVIYIYRDPRDILPSFADHMGKNHAETAELMNNPMTEVGKLPKIPAFITTWSYHVLSFLGNERMNIFMTSYEDMHERTEFVLKSALQFIGIEDIDDEAVAKAVESVKFENLQKLEDAEGFLEKIDHQERFFRRGIVGSHRDEVGKKIIKKIEEDHGDVMRMLGYLDE